MTTMGADLPAWERKLLEKEVADDKADAEALRRAGRALRRRSKRPNSFWLTVIVKILRNAADEIDHGPS